jgi:hypothetical protein
VAAQREMATNRSLAAARLEHRENLGDRRTWRPLLETHARTVECRLKADDSRGVDSANSRDGRRGLELRLRPRNREVWPQFWAVGPDDADVVWIAAEREPPFAIRASSGLFACVRVPAEGGKDAHENLKRWLAGGHRSNNSHRDIDN